MFTAFFFWETLHWPVGSEDMGHFGGSYLELLILFEQWVGHRFLSEKVIKTCLRAHRPISFSSVPVSEGIEIRHVVSTSLVWLGLCPSPWWYW